MHSLHAISYTIDFCILNDILFLSKLSVASTEGMTATCAAVFGLHNLTNWNLRLQLLNLANNKVKQKWAKTLKQLMLAYIMY